MPTKTAAQFHSIQLHKKRNPLTQIISLAIIVASVVVAVVVGYYTYLGVWALGEDS